MTKLKIEGWIPSTEVPGITEITVTDDTGIQYIMKIEYIEIDARTLPTTTNEEEQ